MTEVVAEVVAVVVIGEFNGAMLAANSFLLPLFYYVIFHDIRLHVLMIKRLHDIMISHLNIFTTNT